MMENKKHAYLRFKKTGYACLFVILVDSTTDKSTFWPNEFVYLKSINWLCVLQLALQLRTAQDIKIKVIAFNYNLYRIFTDLIMVTGKLLFVLKVRRLKVLFSFLATQTTSIQMELDCYRSFTYRKSLQGDSAKIVKFSVLVREY